MLATLSILTLALGLGAMATMAGAVILALAPFPTPVSRRTGFLTIVGGIVLFTTAGCALLEQLCP